MRGQINIIIFASINKKFCNLPRAPSRLPFPLLPGFPVALWFLPGVRGSCRGTPPPGPPLRRGGLRGSSSVGPPRPPESLACVFQGGFVDALICGLVCIVASPLPIGVRPVPPPTSSGACSLCRRAFASLVRRGAPAAPVAMPRPCTPAPA